MNQKLNQKMQALILDIATDTDLPINEICTRAQHLAKDMQEEVTIVRILTYKDPRQIIINSLETRAVQGKQTMGLVTVEEKFLSEGIKLEEFAHSNGRTKSLSISRLTPENYQKLREFLKTLGYDS